MTNEAMRAAFEAWWDKPRSKDVNGNSVDNRRDPLTVWKAATAAERERCAKVCEDMSFYESPSDCADAIRQGTDPAEVAEVAR